MTHFENEPKIRASSRGARRNRPAFRRGRSPFLLSVLVALASVPAFSAAEQEPAREGSEEEDRRDLRGDELRERIPAVTGHLFRKGGRHELSPVANISVADAFSRKYIGALAYTLHLREHFAVTARAGYTLASRHSGTVQVCPEPTDCRPPTSEELATLPGQLELVAGLQAELSPVYGKINLIAERVLHFDLYVTAGLGACSYSLRKLGEDESGISPALMLGLGQRYFLNQWLALRLELLDVMYLQPTGKRNRQLRNEFLFTIGASFFFPTSFTYDELR